MSFLTKIQTFLRRAMRFSIPNLMLWVVGGQAALYVLARMGLPVFSWFSLTRAGLMRGEIWRLITFVFLPETTSLFSLALSLYFYWMVGSALQAQWGSSRFTAFYLFGIAGAILSCLFTGLATNTYLNLSLFLAFAAVYPDFQLLLFFILPIKVKYLAVLDAALLLYNLIVSPWYAKAAILFSLLNLILFMGGDLINTLRNESRYWKTRRNFRRTMGR